MLHSKTVSPKKGALSVQLLGTVREYLEYLKYGRPGARVQNTKIRAKTSQGGGPGRALSSAPAASPRPSCPCSKTLAGLSAYFCILDIPPPAAGVLGIQGIYAPFPGTVYTKSTFFRKNCLATYRSAPVCSKTVRHTGLLCSKNVPPSGVSCYIANRYAGRSCYIPERSAM